MENSSSTAEDSSQDVILDDQVQEIAGPESAQSRKIRRVAPKSTDVTSLDDPTTNTLKPDNMHTSFSRYPKREIKPVVQYWRADAYSTASTTSGPSSTAALYRELSCYSSEKNRKAEGNRFLNNGNTCYINSILQSLFRLPLFVQELMEEFLKIEATSNQPPTSETSAPQHEIAPTESIAQPSTSTGVTPQKVQPTLIDLHTFMESTRTHTLSESVVDLTADDHSKNEVDADQPVVQSEQSRPKEATTTTATTQSTQQAATEGQTQRQLLQSVISVVLKMQQPGHGVVNAKEIKNAVATYCNQFGDNTQQDAHEFLAAFMDTLESELTKRNSSWTAADIHKQLSCTNCTNKSDKIEHFKCLSLVVPPRVGHGEPMPTLDQLLHAFFQEEEIQRRCTRCGHNGCKTQYRPEALPRVLVLHLKRFSTQNAKIETPVKIIKKLDLAFCCTDTAKSPRGFPYEQSEAAIQKLTEQLRPKFEQLLLDNKKSKPQTANNNKPATVPFTMRRKRKIVNTEQRELQADLFGTATASSSPSQQTVTTPSMPSTEKPPNHDDSDTESCPSEAPSPAQHPQLITNPVTPPSPQLHSRAAPDNLHSLYYLHSIVSHNGRLSTQGHYICHTYDPLTAAWSKCNDVYISEETEAAVLQDGGMRNGYLLFYVNELCYPQQPPSPPTSPPPSPPPARPRRRLNIELQKPVVLIEPLDIEQIHAMLSAKRSRCAGD